MSTHLMKVMVVAIMVKIMVQVNIAAMMVVGMGETLLLPYLGKPLLTTNKHRLMIHPLANGNITIYKIENANSSKMNNQHLPSYPQELSTNSALSNLALRDKCRQRFPTMTRMIIIKLMAVTRMQAIMLIQMQQKQIMTILWTWMIIHPMLWMMFIRAPSIF